MATQRWTKVFVYRPAEKAARVYKECALHPFSRTLLVVEHNPEATRALGSLVQQLALQIPASNDGWHFLRVSIPADWRHYDRAMHTDLKTFLLDEIKKPAQPARYLPPRLSDGLERAQPESPQSPGAHPGNQPRPAPGNPSPGR